MHISFKTICQNLFSHKKEEIMGNAEKCGKLFTYMHMQGESMEWRKYWCGWLCTKLSPPNIIHMLKH